MCYTGSCKHEGRDGFCAESDDPPCRYEDTRFDRVEIARQSTMGRLIDKLPTIGEKPAEFDWGNFANRVLNEGCEIAATNRIDGDEKNI